MKVTDYEGYFKNIAEKHKDILHSSTAQHFFRLNIEEFDNANRTSIKYPCLVLENYEGAFQDASIDNIQDKHTGAFMIISNAIKGNYDSETQALDTCKAIGDQIIAKMRKDSRDFKNGDNNLSFLKDFNVSTVSYQRVSQFFGDKFGFRYEFTFAEPANLIYDASKWL